MKVSDIIKRQNAVQKLEIMLEKAYRNPEYVKQKGVEERYASAVDELVMLGRTTEFIYYSQLFREVKYGKENVTDDEWGI